MLANKLTFSEAHNAIICMNYSTERQFFFESGKNLTFFRKDYRPEQGTYRI